MKVYLVLRCIDYEGYDVEHICNSKELAEKKAQEFKESGSYYDSVEIVEKELEEK